MIRRKLATLDVLSVNLDTPRVVWFLLDDAIYVKEKIISGKPVSTWEEDVITVVRSSTCAPLLLLLHHTCGPSCKSQVYLINFPHSRICFIITISTTSKSFFQSFLNILRFSHFIHYYCGSLSNPSYHSFLYIWTVTVQLLLSRFSTIIVCLSSDF
jgi:hypothetical protein